MCVCLRRVLNKAFQMQCLHEIAPAANACYATRCAPVTGSVPRQPHKFTRTCVMHTAYARGGGRLAGHLNFSLFLSLTHSARRYYNAGVPGLLQCVIEPSTVMWVRRTSWSCRSPWRTGCPSCVISHSPPTATSTVISCR